MSEKIASDSKNMPTGFFSWESSLAIPIVIMTLRANLETLLVMIRSIFPALQSAIIALNASLCFSEVPLIPSSAYISDYDGNDQIFEERSNEIRTTEQDERNALVNTYRIYKTIPVAEGTKLLFRFWGSSECVEQLYAHKTVAINNSAYKYKKGEDSIQAIIIETEIKEDLYDRWIQFI